MKKNIFLMLVTVLTCSILMCTGCGKSSDEDNTTADEKTSEAGNTPTGEKTSETDNIPTDGAAPEDVDTVKNDRISDEAAVNSLKTGDALPASEDGIPMLSFKAAASYDTLKQLDGKEVCINGFLATSSPADGSFIFLMNMPYQSCPFCVPNTSQLANTLEVYPEKGESFDYTTQAVRVTGTLTCAPETEPFVDDYGYEFNYKLIDADYKILTDSELSSDMALWQKISDSGIITELYDMYNYLDFVVEWNNYYDPGYTKEDGTVVPGCFFWASDAMYILENEYADYTAEGYFSSFIERLKAYNDPLVDSLITNVEAAGKLAEKCISKLYAGEYEYEHRYVEEFETDDDVYTIIGGEELIQEYNDLYYGFADWIDSWEL